LLTKDFFARKGAELNVEDGGEEQNTGYQHSDRPGYERVSSSMIKQREYFLATIIKCSWKYHRQSRPSSSQIAENEGRLMKPTIDVFDSIDTIGSENRRSSAQITEIGGRLMPDTTGNLDSIDFIDLDLNLEEINTSSQEPEKKYLEVSKRDEQS